MTHGPIQTSRRSVLLSAAGGAAAAGLGLSSQAHAATPDLSDPADFLTAVIKMRGATDGSLALGWIMGQRYAVYEGRAIPMFGLLAGTFFTYTRIDELTFEMRSFEVAYWTDLETGKLLERWQNPITGKTVDVPQTRMGPSVVPVKPGGFDLSAVPRMAALESNHMFRPAVTKGDDIWITEEIKISGDPPTSGPAPFRYNEMTTYNAKLSDLAKPDLVTVPTSIQYQSMVGFTPWAGMDGLDAMNMGRGSGRRETRVEDMPAYYLELTEKYHSDVLNDPIAVLNGPRHN